MIDAASSKNQQCPSNMSQFKTPVEELTIVSDLKPSIMSDQHRNGNSSCKSIDRIFHELDPSQKFFSFDSQMKGDGDVPSSDANGMVNMKTDKHEFGLKTYN
jgi:hypothetical protein